MTVALIAIALTVGLLVGFCVGVTCARMDAEQQGMRP